MKESKQVNLIGIASHIGSQISKESLVLENLDSLLNVLKILEKNDQKINFVDIGGGFGITYKDEKNLSPSKLLPKIIDKVGPNINIILEPASTAVIALLVAISVLCFPGSINVICLQPWLLSRI